MGNDAEPNWRSLRYPRSESDWLIHAAVSLLMALAFAQLLVWGLEAEAPSAITRRTLHKVLSELPDDPAPPTLRKKLDGHVVCLVGRLKGGQIHDKQTGFAWQGLRLQRNREVLTGGCKSSTQTGSAQARTTCSAGARHTVTDLDLTAPAPMLGDFKLSGSLVKQMQLRPLTKGLPDTLTVTDARDGQTVYTRDKAGHKFGGAGQGKVWFEGVGRVNVTLVAMQMKDTLVPFRFPKGVEGAALYSYGVKNCTDVVLAVQKTHWTAQWLTRLYHVGPLFLVLALCLKTLTFPILWLVTTVGALLALHPSPSAAHALPLLEAAEPWAALVPKDTTPVVVGLSVVLSVLAAVVFK